MGAKAVPLLDLAQKIRAGRLWWKSAKHQFGPQLEHYAQFTSPDCRKNVIMLERSPNKFISASSELKDFNYQQRTDRLVCFLWSREG